MKKLLKIVFALAVIGAAIGGELLNWADWPYASDAGTGVRKWRVKTHFPVIAAVTPTAGGIAFIGDNGGNFYALESATNRKLWQQEFAGALAGGVITYLAGGPQKVALAAGFSMLARPTKPMHAKVVVLGLK